MIITVTHECSGKEQLQKAIIQMLTKRIMSIGSVDLPVEMSYDKNTQSVSHRADDKKEVIA